MGVGIFEIIIGPMYSGKTETLINRLINAETTGRKPHLYVPENSRGRYGGVNSWKSLSGLSYSNVTYVPLSKEGILKIFRDSVERGLDLVGIDEVQFFTLPEFRINGTPLMAMVIRALNEAGVDVVAAGLNMDFRGEPFGDIGYLIAIADKITQLYARCDVCGREAYYTQRIVDGKPAPYDSPLVVIGSKELYQARCKAHHEVPGRPSYLKFVKSMLGVL